MKFIRLDCKCDICQGKAELKYISDDGQWDVTLCAACLEKMNKAASTRVVKKMEEVAE